MTTEDRRSLYSNIVTNVLTTLVVGVVASFMATRIAISVLETKLGYLENNVSSFERDMTTMRTVMDSLLTTKVELQQMDKRMERIESSLSARFEAERDLNDKIRRLEIVVSNRGS